MRKGKLSKGRNLPGIILLLTIIFNVFTGFIGSARGEAGIELTFDMETEFEFIVTTKNIFNGSEAQQYRTEMDIKNGDGNGMVSLSEENAFKAEKEAEVKNLEYTKNTFFDRTSLEVISTSVEIVNSSGAVNSTEPLEIIYSSMMEATTKDQKSNWHLIIFMGDNYANGIIQLQAPEGWKIQHNPKNLIEFERNPENTFVAGRVNENHDVEMKIYNPAGLEALSENQNEDNIKNILEENIILLVPLIIIVIIIIIMIIKRGSRKEKNNDLIEEAGDVSEDDAAEVQGEEKK